MQINTSLYRNIVVLTGAGVSAGSGLQTYRGPGGVWEQHNVSDFGSAQAFERDPRQTWRLFGAMREPIAKASPNNAHMALAAFESSLRPDQNFLLATQNVDGLHQRAGSRKVVELHGNIAHTCCSNAACDLPPFLDAASHAESVPACQRCGSVLRPQIVLFGESVSPHAEWSSKRALRDCDLFIAVGTSGVVSPASNFVRAAAYAGARTIYVNLTPMETPNPAFKETHLGKAQDILPGLLNGA